MHCEPHSAGLATHPRHRLLSRQRTRANDKGSKRPPWIGATYAELATEARRLTSGVFRRRCGSGHKQRAQAPSQAGALSVVSSRGDDGAARGTDGQHL